MLCAYTRESNRIYLFKLERGVRTPTSGRASRLRLALPKVTNSNSSCAVCIGAVEIATGLWIIRTAFETATTIIEPTVLPLLRSADILPTIIIPRTQTSIYAFHFQGPISDSKNNVRFSIVRRIVRGEKELRKKCTDLLSIFDHPQFQFVICLNL